jgi:AcrR family transcriptional regulator
MAKAKDKKEAIMESALELFTTKGFDNTSTASISKNAGVATGTLFTYFESKLELINELYLSTKKELFSSILFEDIPNSFGKDEFYTVWKNMIDWGVSNPCKMKFVIQYSSSPYISQLT